MPSTSYTTDPNSLCISSKAKQVFSSLWSDIQTQKTEPLSFPKVIFWLNGAPGAGKGTHLPLILKTCHLKEEAFITISDLLNSPEDKKRKARGLLVDDKIVLKRLFEALQSPIYKAGVVVDGFPRTQIQSEYVVLFFEALKALVPASAKVQFHSIVLHVNEALSVERQLLRGKKALQHNASVLIKGEGPILNIRETDIDPEAAARRYEIFAKQTLDALETLEASFPCHAVDANGDLKVIAADIVSQLSKI
jgi:adenylate kinase